MCAYKKVRLTTRVYGNSFFFMHVQVQACVNDNVYHFGTLLADVIELLNVYTTHTIIVMGHICYRSKHCMVRVCFKFIMKSPCV